VIPRQPWAGSTARGGGGGGQGQGFLVRKASETVLTRKGAVAAEVDKRTWGREKSLRTSSE
jgi:hypothetical protein